MSINAERPADQSQPMNESERAVVLKGVDLFNNAMKDQLHVTFARANIPEFNRLQSSLKNLALEAIQSRLVEKDPAASEQGAAEAWRRGSRSVDTLSIEERTRMLARVHDLVEAASEPNTAEMLKLFKAVNFLREVEYTDRTLVGIGIAGPGNPDLTRVAMLQEATKLFAASRRDGIAEKYAAGARELFRLDSSLGTLEKALRDAGLIEERDPGYEDGPKSMIARPRQAAVVTNDQAKQIADAAASVVQEASQPHALAILVQEDAGALLREVLDTEQSLRILGYKTPANFEVAAAMDTRPVSDYITETPMSRLHDVAAASLRLLEEMHKSGEQAPQIRAEEAELVERLRAAEYLVPGDSDVRTESYAAQKPRGTRAQLEAIVDAANNMEQAFTTLATESYGINEKIARNELRLAVHRTEPERTVREAEPSMKFGESPLLPAPMADDIAKFVEASNRIVNHAGLDTYDPHAVRFRKEDLTSATEILDRLNGIEKAEKGRDYSAPTLNYSLGMIEAGEPVSGLTRFDGTTLRDLVDLVSNLRKEAEQPDPKDPTLVVDETVMLRLDRLVDRAVYNGSYDAICAHAGRDGLSRDQLVEGANPAVGFGSARDVILAGSRPDRPNLSNPLGNATPEMSRAQYESMLLHRRSRAALKDGKPIEQVWPALAKPADRTPAKGEQATTLAVTTELDPASGAEQVRYTLTRDRSTTPAPSPEKKTEQKEAGSKGNPEKLTSFFILEPGRWPFAEIGHAVPYRTKTGETAELMTASQLQSPIAAQARAAKVRNILRDQMKDPRIPALLMGLHDKSIVAPTREEARAVREISEQVIAQYRHDKEQVATFATTHSNDRESGKSSAIPKFIVEFPTSEVARLVHAVEISGSKQADAIILKQVQDGAKPKPFASLQHPDSRGVQGPVTGEPNNAFRGARPGERLGVVPLTELAAAAQSGTRTISIEFVGNRFERIVGTEEVVKAPVRQKKDALELA